MKSQTQTDHKLDLEKLLAYPLTPVPYSIGLADGFLAKTEKSKGFKHVLDVFLPSNPTDCLIIEDDNAIFLCLSEVPGNFGKIPKC